MACGPPPHLGTYTQNTLSQETAGCFSHTRYCPTHPHTHKGLYRDTRKGQQHVFYIHHTTNTTKVSLDTSLEPRRKTNTEQKTERNNKHEKEETRNEEKLKQRRMRRIKNRRIYSIRSSGSRVRAAAWSVFAYDTLCFNSEKQACQGVWVVAFAFENSSRAELFYSMMGKEGKRIWVHACNESIRRLYTEK